MLRTFQVLTASGHVEPQRIDTNNVLAVAPGRSIQPIAGVPNGSMVALLVDGRNGWFRVAGDFHAPAGAGSEAGAIHELERAGWPFEHALLAAADVPTDLIETHGDPTDAIEACLAKDAQPIGSTMRLGIKRTRYALGSVSLEVVESEDWQPRSVRGAV